MQRAYLLGFRVGARRSNQQGRKEMHKLAATFDAELVSLGHEFDALARELKSFEQAIGVAIRSERGPNATLH